MNKDIEELIKKWKNISLEFSNNLIDAIENSANVCGGTKCCENRKYDNKNVDCKECSDDYETAMKESLKEININE